MLRIKLFCSKLAPGSEGGDSPDRRSTDTNASTDKAADAAARLRATTQRLGARHFSAGLCGSAGNLACGHAGAAPTSSPAASASSLRIGHRGNTGSSGGSMQQLVALWRSILPAGAQGKSDADASRSDVATTLGPPATPARPTLLEALNSLASFAPPSLAHLGAASHFSLHSQTVLNTA